MYGCCTAVRATTACIAAACIAAACIAAACVTGAHGPGTPATANPDLVPIRSVGTCAPDAGAPAAEVLAPHPWCRTLGMRSASRAGGRHRGERDVARVEVADSAAAFSARYDCPAPARVDFSRQRVATLVLDRMSNERVTVTSVRVEPGRATIRVAKRTDCTGVRPVPQAKTFLVALPASNAAIDVETCALAPPPCGPVP